MSGIVRRRNKEESKDHLIQQAVEENERKIKDDSTLLSSHHWVFISIFYAFLILGAIHLHQCLPTPKDPNQSETQFSETRAVKILHELSDFGWKPAGSYNCEELTRNRILKELRNIKSEYSSEQTKFDIDTQYVSGCFDIPAHDTEGMNICYRNVSNVIARLGNAQNKEDDISVLLNCHYDSWPTSNAGSDDLSSCALMLELIRIYSKNPSLLKHNVIFLFNGAEESSLLAAHGFITQHPWRHTIRAFINLEASGSGGRELLFQAGPANEWLLNSYLAAAVHPHCSVIGQEVFQSGVYPGDTDFRVFRDHGRVPGLDLAFVQNGYWWHTEFDEAKRITNGSIQRAGENVYSTLNYLLSSPYLEKPAEHADDKTVFFDFLGLFVVIYPLSVAHTVNILAIILVVVVAVKEFNRSSSIFFSAIAHYILVCLSMALVVYIMTVMSNFTYGAMRWYSRHWLALVAYGLPCLWSGLTVQSLLTARIAPKIRDSYSRCLEIIHLIVVSSILLVFTYYNIASGFLFALMLIPTVKIILNHFGLLPESPTLLTILTVSLSFPGCSMAIYTTEMLTSIFIPIMGRTSGNPEPAISIFVAFSAFSIVLSLIGLIAKSKVSRSADEAGALDWFYNITGVILINLVILYVFASIWPSPFRFNDLYPTAKRTQFFHVNQALYDRNGDISVDETRFYAIAQDYRGAEDIPFVKSDANYTLLQCHYANNPYCEVPFLFPTRGRISEKHVRVRKLDEVLKFPTKVKILPIWKRKGQSDGGQATVDYSFSVIGTGQISAYLIPDANWQITNTSVSTPAVPQNHMFLYFTCSTPNNVCEWIFNVKIQMTVNHVADEKPLLVGISSHYLHGDHMQSKTIKNMITKIAQNRQVSPEWTVTASAWNVDQVYKFF